MNKLIIAAATLLPETLMVKLARAYAYRNIKKFANLQVSGLENLNDADGPFLFICNHLSNADGVILNKVLEKQKIHFVAGKKLEGNVFTNIFLKIVRTIPIQADSADKEAMQNIIQTVKSGSNILIFPEGTRSRSGTMISGKKGILLIAKLTKAKIIPLGITGSEQFMPINPEMDKEKFQSANVVVKIGKPFSLMKKQAEQSKKDWEQAALDHLMQNIAVLLPESYRGVYSQKEGVAGS
jgi:1-acyl-sn-glycerol-3-phosphate acyltransferase